MYNSRLFKQLFISFLQSFLLISVLILLIHFSQLVCGGGENMSIAIKQRQQGQCLQSFRMPNKKIQSTEVHTHTLDYWNGKKSIELKTKSQDYKDVARGIIPKELIRQIPVARVETIAKLPEDRKAKSQSLEIDGIRTLNEIDDPYCSDSKEIKDLRIYQNGQVNAFFENKQLKKPTKVSDICLVNDHYILVKMLDNFKEKENSNSLILAAKRREDFRALKEKPDRTSVEESINRSKKLSSYLRSKRNRITRIAPIHEEPEDLSDLDKKSTKTQSRLDCLKMPSCWQANDYEQETYETRTTIYNSLQNNQTQNGSSPEIDVSSKPLEQQERIDNFKDQGIQTISGSLLQSSLQYQVSLHNCGVLVDSQNNNNVLAINSPPRRKSPRFESFYWLLRPFRGKYRKPKPKIQAVVYKTYFVKWTKPSDTQSHDYGVRTARSTEMGVSVLRRCRSAIF